MGLGPPQTHWSLEHFQKYSEEDLMKDVFEDGHVDVAVFQPTYLKEWYKEGFNTTERNALMGEKHPGRLVYNPRWDPRDGAEGLPRIEDFCFMATQEPNVYAGLAVVIGGLMHARPRFFAKVMGELLFWVGEDKMLFGSDYAIWEPKWQIEGFVDWDFPDSDDF